jgi:hypothetical protein
VLRRITDDEEAAEDGPTDEALAGGWFARLGVAGARGPGAGTEVTEKVVALSWWGSPTSTTRALRA